MDEVERGLATAHVRWGFCGCCALGRVDRRRTAVGMHFPDDPASPKTQRQTIKLHELGRMKLQTAVPVKSTADEFHRRALGAPSFLECHRIEILTVTPDFSFPNIPHMGVWKIGAFVRCAVNASKTAQRDDS